jgi:Mg/Co/Ni transporter MgtE
VVAHHHILRGRSFQNCRLHPAVACNALKLDPALMASPMITTMLTPIALLVLFQCRVAAAAGLR